MNPRITVVGSINMDLVFRTGRMPAVGETIHGHAFHQIPGGKGANQAVAAARLGGSVRFVGSIGDDGFGAESLRTLAAEGIDLAHVRTVRQAPTGTAGIFVADDGSNSIVVVAGANGQLDVAQVDAAVDAITAAQLLICQLETPLPTVTHAIGIAHARGVPVMLNPAPAQALDDELLRRVDYLIVNETEAAQLSGIDVSDHAAAVRASQALLARGARAVLLTMGEHGVHVSQAGSHEHLPAIAVRVVDTTAAGDTFVGAFAVAIARGLTARDAGAEAQYAAALAVTRLGAQPSIPRRADVDAFMRDGKVPD